MIGTIRNMIRINLLEFCFSIYLRLRMYRPRNNYKIRSNDKIYIECKNENLLLEINNCYRSEIYFLLFLSYMIREIK